MSEKWYTKKSSDEIINEMSRTAHNAVACAIQGEESISRDLFNLFNIKYYEVENAIIDIKTEFYIHRDSNPIYGEWENCLNNLRKIKRSMEFDIKEALATN